MSKHEKSSGNSHGRDGKREAVHKDWRMWTVVGLMLIAMGAYVMSDNESLPTGGEIHQEMPEAE